MSDLVRTIPETIDQAVDRLLAVLSLREKTEIVRMGEEDLPQLHQSIGVYIRSEITCWSQNESLSREARELPGVCPHPYMDEVSNAICLALWRKLKKVHALRLIPRKDASDRT